jgi:MFS family permease
VANSAITVAASRPTGLLPRSQLLAISIYWFGINALWGGYEIFGQHRVEEIVGVATRGEVLGYLEFAAALVAILVQPTVGTISDYASTRWGRRKPFILIGTALDVLMVLAIATSHTLLALALFLMLLQFSSNFAQGPFQGYVPDLVPERQVNVASALMGLMRMLGVICGAGIVATGATTGDFATPLIVIVLIEFGLAVATVLLVHEGPRANPRHGRSWLSIAREAWGTDLLQERGFLAMTVTRLLFLMGPAVFVNISLYYMRDSLGLTLVDLTTWLTIGPAAIGVGAVFGTLPSAWLADRIGRKQVVWLAGAIAAAGIVLVARAQSPTEALPGLVLIGLGSGAYLAVDWALMTSAIPRISSGRYMGLANSANSIAGPLALIIGGRVLDEVTRTVGLDAGPRAATLTGILFIAGAALMLIFVRSRSEPPAEAQLAEIPPFDPVMGNSPPAAQVRRLLGQRLQLGSARLDHPQAGVRAVGQQEVASAVEGGAIVDGVGRPSVEVDVAADDHLVVGVEALDQVLARLEAQRARHREAEQAARRRGIGHPP